MGSKTRICVLGGGIIGVTSGVYIQRENPSLSITLIADKFSPNTTADISAGLWGPYLLGNTPAHKIVQWSKKTHDFFASLWQSENAGEIGISMIPVLRISEDEDYGETLPIWKDIVYGFRPMTPKELSPFQQNNSKIKKGFAFTTFTCESSKFIPFLMEEFIRNGGRIIKKRVENLNELKEAGFDLIVNCPGVEAQKFVPDPKVAPKRGQTIRIEASGICHAIIDDTGDGTNHIIPNSRSVMLGGTHQDGDWNKNCYPEDRKFIKDGCEKLAPRIKGSKILYEEVGLRPGRGSLRLEMETTQNENPTFKKFHVIHNYGHSGSGITLSWGTAEEVNSLVQKALLEHQLSKY